MQKTEIYRDLSSYPEIRVKEPNHYYSNLLKDDFAGPNSEFTAISQYLYHHFITKNMNREISEMLEGISLTEMHHLEILADLIKLLGGDPVYRGDEKSNDFWSGDVVYYGCVVYDMLLADLRGEYTAIKNYRNHITCINDPYVKEILERIILDEKVHVQLFKNMIIKYFRRQN